MKTTTTTTTNSTAATISPRGKEYPVFAPVGADDDNRAQRLDAVRAVFDAVRNGERAGQALFTEVKAVALELYPDHEALSEVKESDTAAIRAEFEALGMAKVLISKAVKAAQNNYQPFINAIKRGASRADIMASGKSGLERANALSKKLGGIDLGERVAIGKDPMAIIEQQASCIKKLDHQWQTFEHLFEEGQLLLAPAITTLLQQGVSAEVIADTALRQQATTAEAVKLAATM